MRVLVTGAGGQLGSAVYRELERRGSDASGADRCSMDITEKYEVYHATDEGGYLSWCDFAREIFRQAGRGNKVIPVTTAEYGLAKAARPLNSRLDKSKLDEMGFARLPDWRDALGRYITEQNKVGDCVRGERQYRGKECC